MKKCEPSHISIYILLRAISYIKLHIAVIPNFLHPIMVLHSVLCFCLSHDWRSVQRVLSARWRHFSALSRRWRARTKGPWRAPMEVLHPPIAALRVVAAGMAAVSMRGAVQPSAKLAKLVRLALATPPPRALLHLPAAFPLLAATPISLPLMMMDGSKFHLARNAVLRLLAKAKAKLHPSPQLLEALPLHPLSRSRVDMSAALLAVTMRSSLQSTSATAASAITLPLNLASCSAQTLVPKASVIWQSISPLTVLSPSGTSMLVSASMSTCVGTK